VMEQGATGIEELTGDPGWVKLRGYFEGDRRKRSILRSLRRYLNSLEGIDPAISRPGSRRSPLGTRIGEKTGKDSSNPSKWGRGLLSSRPGPLSG